MGLLALFAAQAHHTGGGAHGVNVGVFVAHDEDFAGLGDEFRERIGYDAGFDLGAPFRLLGLAAVEREVVPVLDDGLIAAAAQRHLNTQRGKTVVFGKRCAVFAEAQGQRGSDTRGVYHFPDGFQNGELVLHKFRQVLGFKQEQIPVALQLPQQTVHAVGPGRQAVVDGGVDGGHHAVGQIADQLIVVVHQQNGYDGTGTDILVPDLQQLRHVHQIDGGQKQGGVILIGVNLTAQHAIAAIAQGVVAGAFGLALGQPADGQLGQYRLQLGTEGGGLETRQLVEMVVGPEHLVVGNGHNGHGQRQFVPQGRVQGGGGGLNVPENFLFLPSRGNPEQHQHHRRHRQLRTGQHILAHEGRHGGQEQQNHKIEGGAGHQKPHKRVVHKPSHLSLPGDHPHRVQIDCIIAKILVKLNGNCLKIRGIFRAAGDGSGAAQKNVYTFSPRCGILYHTDRFLQRQELCVMRPNGAFQ